jgi:DNA-binding response OmpR family regulator
MSSRSSALLIIEHDASVRQLYARTLREPYILFEANSVAECHQTFSDQDIVTVIIEPHRPDGLGDTILQMVRAYCHPRNIPIVVCSVLDANQDSQHSGVHKHLVKPVAPERLRAEMLRIV